MNRRTLLSQGLVGVAAFFGTRPGFGYPFHILARRADPITLPKLPYDRNALSPYISARTLDFHYGKHHAGYVRKLNAGIKGTPWANKSLEEIILGTAEKAPKIFNNAAQTWNHSFYWASMKPKGGGEPSGKLKSAIEASFGDMDAFRAAFLKAAGGLFGSGWTWLVKNEKTLEIRQTQNAGTPLVDHRLTPLLTLDVWEHAYYLDYQNGRKAYIQAWLDHLVDWEAAARRLG
ncbi:MAG TPA: superoxide dismutase [Planctomycetes bacterium]|nr:superoxide dismutase [Planctomycetota bacterium]